MNNKKIIFQVTRQYMKQNRRRTAITFLGISLMVMMMTCVFVGKDTALGYLQRVISVAQGNWHLIAYGLDAETAGEVAAIDGIDRIGYSARLGFTDFPQSANEERPYLEVKAYSPDVFELMNLHVTQGRLPERAQELVISDTALRDGASVKVGDVIEAKFFDRSVTGINPDVSESVFPYFGLTVAYGETAEVPLEFPYYAENPDFRQNKDYRGTGGRYTVVGVVKEPYFESAGSAGYPAFTLMEDYASVEGTFQAVMTFDLGKIDSVMTVGEQIRQITGDETENNGMLLAFANKGSDSDFNRLAVFVQVFFVLLIMAASLILIYNVFNMSYRERTKYLGMLSSVGATGRQKRFSVYYEAVLLLVPSLPVGILMGFGVIKGGMLLLKPYFDRMIQTWVFGLYDDIPASVSVQVGNLLLVTAMSFVTVMLSALIPAVKMGRIGPVESIRGNDGRGGKRFRTRFSLLRKGRAEALLAVCGTSRSPHLTRGIVRSIAVFGVLSMVTLYGAQSVVRLVNARMGANQMTYNFTGYDYVFYTDRYHEGLYNAAKQRVEQNDAVTRSRELTDYFGGVMLNNSALSDEYWEALETIILQYDGADEAYAREMLEGLREQPQFLYLFFLGDEDFRKLAAAGNADMRIVDDASVPSVLLYRKVELSTRNFLISGMKADYRLMEVQQAFQGNAGDDFPLIMYTPDEENEGESKKVPLSLTIAGFLDEAALRPYFTAHSEKPLAIINQSAAEKISRVYEENNGEHDVADRMLLFGIKKGEGSALLKELSQFGQEGNNEAELVSYDAMNGGTGFESTIVSIIEILADCFTALISGVCLLNLYNSVKGRALERRREIAMLRSMGMTDRQLYGMLAEENALLLLRGYLIAGLLSGAFMLVLNRVMVMRFGNISLPVPFGLMAGIAGAGCAVMVLMTFLCYRFSDKESLVEEIRRETV